jgi:o-succinylbenzoate---CoA ligase
LSRGLEAKGGASPDWLRWRSEISPDSLALKVGEVEWSYGELHEMVGALAAGMRSLGVGRGDRLALLMSPSEQYVASIHAIARLGAVAVPLNHRHSTQELLLQLKDSAPSAVIHDDALGDRAEELKARGPKGRARPRWELAAKLIESARGRMEPIPGRGADASSPHAIIYTSGSRGEPKGVKLTLSNFMWNAISVGLRIGVSPSDRWLLCLPLFHVGGYSIVFRSVLHGSGVVLHRRFDPKRVLLSLDNDRITLASFVPKMLADILEARGGTPFPSGLRAIFLGGGQPPARLLAAAKKRKLPVLLTYGMTETCSQVALSGTSSSPGGPAYLPMFPSEVVVTKPGKGGGLELAGPGELGEVAVRGPTLFAGYWRKRALTKAVFRGRWFLTGDLGALQLGDGRRGGSTDGIAILGRKEETIVTGGEKVIPGEVEAALREHPAVSDAVVVGVDDARWGQRVVAVVETREARSRGPPSSSEMRSFLRERLGVFKIPKQYVFCTALPRTPDGKTQRGKVLLLLEGGDEPK